MIRIYRRAKILIIAVITKIYYFISIGIRIPILAIFYNFISNPRFLRE